MMFVKPDVLHVLEHNANYEKHHLELQWKQEHLNKESHDLEIVQKIYRFFFFFFALQFQS